MPNAKADAAKDKTPPANGKDKDKAVVAPHKPTTPPSADVGAEPKPKPNEGSNGNGPGTTPPGSGVLAHLDAACEQRGWSRRDSAADRSSASRPRGNPGAARARKPGAD